MTDIAVVLGSLRRGAYSRKLAAALAELAPASMRLELVDIDDLALYNQDFDDQGAAPESWRRLRNRIRRADAVLFVTPEYNRSVPGPLKNAIDVASRPFGESSWDGKPCAVVSVSPGAIGGFGANHHLRQSLVFLNMPVMQQPEAYIGGATDLFDEHAAIAKPDVEEFLREFLAKFEAWIELTGRVPSGSGAR